MIPNTNESRIAVHGILLGEGPAAEHYVLRVVGDSMIEEGILDGDYVVILRRHAAEDGEMVVAQVGDDAILRRLFHAGASFRLESSNRLVAPVILPAADVEIRGIVVWLIRRFLREPSQEESV